MVARAEIPAIRTAWSLVVHAALIATPATAAKAQQPLPDAIAVPGGLTVMMAHAVGAQIYECAADTAGRPGWRFREPIATLLVDGRTIGRHFAGPSWQLTDGSLIVGKVVARAPGA